MSVPLFNLAPDMTVSRLCLGTMTFGEQNSLSQSSRLLDQAYHAGINFFDSAEMYPVPQRAETQGRSEEYFGRWIRDRKIPRDGIVFATKVSGPSGQMTWIRGGPKCLDAKNITEAINKSLERTRMDYIDLYQIHWPDRYVPMFGESEYDPIQQYSSVPIEEQLDALGKAVDADQEYLDVAKRYGIHPVSLAIAFVLRHRLVASTIFGATKSWQLNEVLNSCNVELTSELMAEINRIHARYPNPCP